MVSKTNKLFFNIVNKKKLKIQLKQFLGPMTKSTKVVIVVLGDIGHSPRMCNHAYSFAQKENVEVEIFGYLHSKPHEKIFNSEKIRLNSNQLIKINHFFLQNSSFKSASILFIQSILANADVDASNQIHFYDYFFDYGGKSLQ
jgi:hypothetical protein